MDLLDLFSKPASYSFSQEELDFIKTKVRRSSMEAKYCLYLKKSGMGLYIGFFIDSEPNAPRRSALFNSWEVVAARGLSEIEYEEEIKNFGCNNRRFLVWMYRDIEALVAEDLKYGVQTPGIFVEECRRRGYVAKN